MMAGRGHLPGGLELDVLVGEYGCEAVEVGAAARGLGLQTVDGLDPDQAEVPLAVLGRPDLAGDVVAGPEAEAADLGLRDVHIAGAGVAAVGLEEAVAVACNGEDAAGEDLAVALGQPLEDLHHQRVPPGGSAVVYRPHLAGEVQQLFVGLVL